MELVVDYYLQVEIELNNNNNQKNLGGNNYFD